VRNLCHRLAVLRGPKRQLGREGHSAVTARASEIAFAQLKAASALAS
jgi:hypothetical protein